MDLAEAYVGPMVDAIYRRLIERDFALEDPEVVMLLTALINILGHDNRGDRPTEVLLMAAYGERGVLDRPNMRVMRWRNGALSGSDLANEPGLGSSRTYQPGEMPMPSKPKPGLTRMHREMNSEATSSGSQLRAAVPPKRAKVTQKVQTNQTIQDLDEMNDQLRSAKKELDEMTRSMLQMEEDRDMWRKLFEDCNKKQGQEIERLRQEYKERSETTSTSREERPSRGSLLWSRSIPSPWHIYKDELMKLDLQRVSFIEDARRMLNGATLSVSRLYSITGVDWLIAASINFSSTTALRFADLEGLPSNNTMGPVNARPLQAVRLNHDEGNREERPGRFLTARAPIGQHVKIFRQLTTPPGHVKERVYPKLVNQDGDAQRYGGLTAIKKDETIFAAYDKAEMRKAKIMVVANSEFVYTSKSLFWPDVIMLTAVDLDLLQSVSLAIGVQRQTDMNPITIVFAGINDHLHSRGFLSRLRDPATAENAVWPAIKDILESMGEVVDATKEGSFNKVALRVVFALSPGYAHLPDGLKFVYAMVALLSEGKYDVIISAPNRMIELENLRPLKAELPAVWSDISNAMRGFKDHALHMLVFDEVLGLELSNFIRQLKLKPGIE